MGEDTGSRRLNAEMRATSGGFLVCSHSLGFESGRLCKLRCAAAIRFFNMTRELLGAEIEKYLN